MLSDFLFAYWVGTRFLCLPKLWNSFGVSNRRLPFLQQIARRILSKIEALTPGNLLSMFAYTYNYFIKHRRFLTCCYRKKHRVKSPKTKPLVLPRLGNLVCCSSLGSLHRTAEIFKLRVGSTTRLSGAGTTCGSGAEAVVGVSARWI